jgi:hypothetical protein
MEQTESRIHGDIVKHIWNTYPITRGLLFHVPNQGKKSIVEASLLKAMGVLAGVSDLIFLWEGRAYFLEVKTPTGVQSKVQKEFEVRIKENGFNYYIVKSIQDAEGVIRNIINA